ncbi:MAG TPA: DEAD/DEAH box helicase [Thermoplasmata archaeon]|nr:DEAD/DEAH box helicase [Thermoplasmata archaeon]
MRRRSERSDPPGPPAAPLALEAAGLDPAVADLLRRDGIRELYPPQAAAIPLVEAGQSLLLACPTASGKSLVAYLALLRAARAGRTGLYLVPLRALAHEKAEELEKFAELGVRVGISIGDFDLRAGQLEHLDVLVATSEKADGLLRRGSPWLDRLGVVVADEVHLLRDHERGPTLEVSLTRLRRAYPGLQVVALSATVGNSEEVAAWLGAAHVASEFRPVPLKMGVYRQGRLTFTDLSSRELAPPDEPVPRLVRTAIEEGGQALVFVNSRRASEQLAKALAPTVGRRLSPDDRALARATSEQLGEIAEEETEGTRRLAALLPHGVAYHNASLTNPERRLVERGFRSRAIKALVATPTLAAGINLPARRVVVRDTTRYDDRLGMQAPIPVTEVRQMLGRAGRPRFDPYGEAVLVARTPDEEDRFLETYLDAAPEAIESRLAGEPALRMHLLALVASAAVRSEADLHDFFAATFYGRTLPLPDLHRKLDRVRGFLERHELLERGTELRATRFGGLTSELYLDPMSAIVLRGALARAPIGVATFPLLAAVAATPDLPALFLRRGEEAEYLARFTDEANELLVQPEEPPLDLDLDGLLATLKTAAVLEAWLTETPIVELTERFGIGAGDLRTKVEDAEWLLFAAGRLATAFQRRLVRPLDDLAMRIRYGVQEELLDLVRLRGIGRVRGRLLFQAGLRDREALRQAPPSRIAAALRSSRLAEMVLAQLNRPSRSASAPVPAPPADPPPSATRRVARRLDDFAEGSEL